MLGLAVDSHASTDGVVLAIMGRITKVFISHAHLDHISGLIVAALFRSRNNVQTGWNVYSIANVKINLEKVEAIKTSRLQMKDISSILSENETPLFEAYPVMHGGIPQVPSSCFAFASRAIVICGDLQPSYTTEASSKAGLDLWKAVASDMKHLFIEVAYPDPEVDGKVVQKSSRTLFGHLSPYYLILELFDIALSKYKQGSLDNAEKQGLLNTAENKLQFGITYLRNIFAINPYVPDQNVANLLGQIQNFFELTGPECRRDLNTCEEYLHSTQLVKMKEIAKLWIKANPLAGLTVHIQHVKTPLLMFSNVVSYPVTIIEQLNAWSLDLNLGMNFIAVAQAKDSIATSQEAANTGNNEPVISSTTPTTLTAYVIGSGDSGSETNLPCLILGNKGEVNGKLIAFNAGSFIAPFVELESMSKFETIFPKKSGFVEKFRQKITSGKDESPSKKISDVFVHNVF